MRKLGISIYPEKSNYEDMVKYIDRAKEAGFSRLFTSLLQVDEKAEDLIKIFKRINHHAKKQNFEIIVDISPRVFEIFGISYQELKFFKELGADGLRLDMNFSGSEEAMMSFNPYGLLLELNMSNDIHMIDTIMDYAPNRYALLGSHNFYPHRYSGLSEAFFRKTSMNFKKYGIRTSAFVTSQNKDSFGPWPIADGLPTLERHRDLPLDVQIKHHIALDLIDDIIIANCYPSEAELDRISHLDLNLLTFDIDPIEGLPQVETSILFDLLHVNRGDINSAFIRSTQSRVIYKGHHFELLNAPSNIKRGDVLMETSLYGHYAGEVQIALQDMQNSGRTNVVGRVREEEIFLLDEVRPWQKFKLQPRKE